MTTSSQPTNFSITSTNDYLSSTDVITITGSSSTDTIIIDDSIGTITLDYGAASTSTYIGGAAGSTITFTGTGSAGFTAQTIGSINPAIFNWNSQEEFIDCFPEFGRVKDMCKEYPGLKIAFEKFVTAYRLCKDDYDTPPDKRIKP